MANEQIEKIRFWCQTVLPTVYDDSLSYYECLCKFAEKLNEIVAFVNELAYDIPDGSITTVKLANGAGTNEKLGTASVTLEKIAGIDTTVTQNSGNLITSGAVYSYIQSLDANEVKY